MKQSNEKPSTTEQASPPRDAAAFSLAPGGEGTTAKAMHPCDGAALGPAPQAESRGLECRVCGCNHFRVLYTRQIRGGKIKRRRQCMNSHCGREITTYEREVLA